MKILTKTSGFITCLTFTLPLWVCVIAQAGNESSKADRNDAESRSRQNGNVAQHALTFANQERQGSQLAENIQNYQYFYDTLQDSLQKEWKRLFGEGISEIPWNGTHPNKSFDRIACPVPIGFWLQDHIFMKEYTEHGEKDGIPWTGSQYKFQIERFIPKDAHFTKKEINAKKEIYRAYVKGFFNKNTLPACGTYLRDSFCAPVSELLQQACHEILVSDFTHNNKKWSTKEELLSIFRLYAAYRQFGMSHLSYDRINGADEIFSEAMDPQPNFQKVLTQMNESVVYLYLRIDRLHPETKTWLFELLENCDQNCFETETLRSYHFNVNNVILGIKRVESNYAQTHNLSLKIQTLFSLTQPKRSYEEIQAEIAQKMEAEGYRLLPNYHGGTNWVQTNDGSKLGKALNWFYDNFP